MRFAAARSVTGRDDLEPVRDAAKALGPFVVFVRQRIEEELEAPLVVMRDRLPDHLAHHVIAQVRRQVADPHASRPALGLRREGLAVDALRRRVVRLREPQHHLRLDIEIQEQVEQHLEAVGELQLAVHPKRLLAKSVQVPFDLLEIAEILARLQRLHRERQRIGAMGLEALEVRDPRVELPGREQRLAQILVRGHVLRIRLRARSRRR